jgi:hypothetical protein
MMLARNLKQLSERIEVSAFQASEKGMCDLDNNQVSVRSTLTDVAL